ncbi:BtpA/SgcQ family protein [Enterocloster asparagiformis]|uniref:BtpA/SgcQ family protein n=1 Tax=Enterocloster asparagiformis TaxID=333367 RepID=UPI002A7F1DB6|nr:BtpA/SgcQ family protein [Enterocloster asparagiformis]
MMMEQHENVFGTKKPLIGCLHMAALPGSYYADPTMTYRDQIRRLKEDAKILMGEGFDACVFANEGDRPYLSQVGPETVASYVRIAAEVAVDLTIPYGCGVLIDPIATLAVAKAIDAKFVRTYVTGTYNGLFGWQTFNPGEIFRYQKQIGAENVRVYTYFEPHAGTGMDTRPVENQIDGALLNLPIAGVLMGGPRAGLPPQATALGRVKERFPQTPLILGSGGRVDNIKELLTIADGVIIGTSIKKEGILWNQIDPQRAAAFVKAAREAKL